MMNARKYLQEKKEQFKNFRNQRMVNRMETAKVELEKEVKRQKELHKVTVETEALMKQKAELEKFNKSVQSKTAPGYLKFMKDRIEKGLKQANVMGGKEYKGLDFSRPPGSKPRRYKEFPLGQKLFQFGKKKKKE